MHNQAISNHSSGVAVALTEKQAKQQDFLQYSKDIVVAEIATNQISQHSKHAILITDLGHDVDDHQVTLSRTVKALINGDNLLVVIDGPNPPLEQMVFKKLVEDLKTVISDIKETDFEGLPLLPDQESDDRSSLIKKLQENCDKAKTLTVPRVGRVIDDQSTNSVHYSGIELSESDQREVAEHLDQIKDIQRTALKSFGDKFKSQVGSEIDSSQKINQPVLRDQYYHDRIIAYREQIELAIKSNMDLELTIICDTGILEYELIADTIENAKAKYPGYQGNIALVTQGDLLNREDFNMSSIHTDALLKKAGIEGSQKDEIIKFQKAKLQQILQKFSDQEVRVICVKGDLNTERNIGCALLQSTDSKSNLGLLQDQYQQHRQQGWANIRGVELIGGEIEFFDFSKAQSKEDYFSKMTLASILSANNEEGNSFYVSTYHPLSQVFKGSENLSSKRMTEIRAFFFKVLTFEDVKENGEKKEYKVQVDITLDENKRLKYNVRQYAEFGKPLDEIPGDVKDKIILATKDTLMKIEQRRQEYEQTLFEELQSQAKKRTQGISNNDLRDLIYQSLDVEHFKRNLFKELQVDPDIEVKNFQATANLELIRDLSKLINDHQNQYGAKFFDSDFSFKSTSKIAILYDSVAQQIQDFISGLNKDDKKIFFDYLQSSNPKTQPSEDLRELINAKFIDQCKEDSKDESTIDPKTKDVLTRFVKSLSSTCENILTPTKVIERLKAEKQSQISTSASGQSNRTARKGLDLNLVSYVHQARNPAIQFSHQTINRGASGSGYLQASPFAFMYPGYNPGVGGSLYPMHVQLHRSHVSLYPSQVAGHMPVFHQAQGVGAMQPVAISTSPIPVFHQFQDGVPIQPISISRSPMQGFNPAQGVGAMQPVAISTSPMQGFNPAQGLGAIQPVAISTSPMPVFHQFQDGVSIQPISISRIPMQGFNPAQNVGAIPPSTTILTRPEESRSGVARPASADLSLCAYV